ncbi:zinc-binding dehydrogenase [Rhodococcus sp. NPDC060090]|uniref:zinc-binding dehydrogenase n=1 Tax=Rhodococcus sp. NPDC060090 TaxID=3347056 RepID=UPI0036468260
MQQRRPLASSCTRSALLCQRIGWDALRSTWLARTASGGLRPLITRFPLSEAAAAHAAVEGRTARGKVVLTSRAQVVRSLPDRP